MESTWPKEVDVTDDQTVSPCSDTVADTGPDMTPEEEQAQQLRMVEALLFAASEPLSEEALARELPEGADVASLVDELAEFYDTRGVNLVRISGKWSFRTAADLSFLLEKEVVEQRKLSRAALETMAIVAYHQPVTRAEIEQIRGVSVSKGTLDVLLETEWVRLRGRRRTPGRPLTYGTTEAFLAHFGLDALDSLPGLDDLKSAGLLDARLPPDFDVPRPDDGDDEDLDPVEDEEEIVLDFGLVPRGDDLEEGD